MIILLLELEHTALCY